MTQEQQPKRLAQKRASERRRTEVSETTSSNLHVNDPNEIVDALLERILAVPRAGKRRLIAIAGPPASGKTTLSELLACRMTAAGSSTLVVPMDGFHLDNRILTAKGLLARKGAPETFDSGGLLRLVGALADADTSFFPVFDRARDVAIAGAGEITGECDTVIVEGNYLLLDAYGWRDLKDCWDFSILLDVPIHILRERLVERWLAYGLTPNQAITRAERNDLRNVELVASKSLVADAVITV